MYKRYITNLVGTGVLDCPQSIANYLFNFPDKSQFILTRKGFFAIIMIANPERTKIMARVSSKKDKNVYQQTRENLGLSRECASELLEWISPERIERIENEKSNPNPDEVLQMADKYKLPSLCNHYCANQCPIGQEYVPEIKVKELSQIILELLASLNAMNSNRERLIEITVNGKIDDAEIEDFIHIQEELERISITVETLQLWSERMLANGVIDEEKYNQIKNKKM